jgi:hypothetical protein
MMFLGYAEKHEGNCYRMFNPHKSSVVETRDVTWLKRMFYERIGSDVTNLDPIVVIEADSASDEVVETQVKLESPGDDESVSSEVSRASSSLEQEVRRSGRTVRQTMTYDPESGKASTIGADISAIQNYYACLAELDNNELHMNIEVENFYLEIESVGAGLGGGFTNTNELKVMKYREAVNGPDGDSWKEEIINEHNRMLKNEVFEAVDKESLPPGTKPIDSTWACKLKSNGTKRGRLNARGFKQVDGQSYDSANIHAPVTNAVTVRLVLVLMLLAGWVSHVVDVKGAFLHGKFEKGEKVYMKVPEGWEGFYPTNTVLLLLRTIYGLKQAAMAFWKELLKAMRGMGLKRSTADPCLYYNWTELGLVIIISWIDDNMIVGSQEVVDKTKKELMTYFECEDCGTMEEYVGNRLTRLEDGGLKFTQDVLIQSFKDEYDISDKKWSTPAAPGTVLEKVKEGEEALSAQNQTYLRSGIGKMIHVMQWSRPEISHAVRDSAKMMGQGNFKSLEAMHRCMEYCVATANRGVTLRPQGNWDGTRDFKFVISGRSDSDYAKDPDTRHSVTGTRVSVNGAPTMWRSATQKHVTLSVTEAEQAAAVTCAQDMIYQKHLLESMTLQVELPMILEVDNKGTVDLANNWSAGGRTRHVDVRQNFLRELKEDGILLVKWIPGPSNDADLHTKNLSGPDFEKHVETYTGKDEYSRMS